MTSSAPITVWLIEDDDLYRQAVTDLLLGAEGILITEVFTTCEDALEQAASGAVPDVVLCDISLPGISGTEGTRRFKSISPLTQIVMLTIHEDENRIFEAVCAGASGYLLKSASSERILQAVREVHQGGVPFAAPVARKVLAMFAGGAAAHESYGLTEREREILQLLAGGASQKSIADGLFLSPHTVDTHLRHIYAKLHVHNGIGAVSKAIRERLI